MNNKTVKIEKAVSPVIRERLKRLYPGKDENELVKAFYMKKFKLMGLILCGGIVLALLLFISNEVQGRISKEGEIIRDDYNGLTIEIPARVYSEQYGEMDVDIAVAPRTYTEEEREEIFHEAEQWLEQVMTGNNDGLDCVRENLVFPGFYEDTDIKIEYSSSNYGLVNGSGEVKNQELEKEEKVLIRAEFSYDNVTKTKDYEVTVYPPILTPEEEFKKALEETLVIENILQKEKEVFLLPKQVGKEQVTFQEKGNKNFIYIFFLGILCALCLYKGMDKDLDKLYEKRQQTLLFRYPEFVSKLALLTGTGMSVTGAIRRIYADKRDEKGDPLYEELGIFVRGLDNGMLEEHALEEFGKRSGLIQYRKFCTLLSINMKKGSLNLKTMLENEAEEAFTNHQQQIKKMGEEAGTKLLLPMIMMLGVVVVIIMIPAFMTYQIS